MTTALLLGLALLTILFLLRTVLIECVRKLLTWLYHVQGFLPGPLAKAWRLAITAALHTIPAVDPLTDNYVTKYKLPRVKPLQQNEQRDGTLITGVTGFVGLHLLDHLLQTTSRKLYVLIRKRSLDKLRREAARYKLSLPGFDARVVLLEGDCKRADLGLTKAQWTELGTELREVYHLAANSSFVATYEVLRGDWMPSFVGLLEFCAREGIGFHMVGSVGRFAVNRHPTRRGVWTSGYMRCKAVQHAVFERFRAAGLTCSWTDCSYIIGTLQSGGVNPGFHDSMWKAAAIQRVVGMGFPGAATLVPVDLLVKGVCANAAMPVGEIVPYMSLRLKSILTSQDIGVARTVGPVEFRSAAAACGFNPAFIQAFVPLDIGELVEAMHKPFDAPAHVAKLFDNVDEPAILKANFEYARPQFSQLDSFMPRAKPRPLEAGLVSSAHAALSLGMLRASRHLQAAAWLGVLAWNYVAFGSSHDALLDENEGGGPLKVLTVYLSFLSHWTLVLVVVYFLLAARLTMASPPAPVGLTDVLAALHSVALPASVAVVPLYWGMLIHPATAAAAAKPIHASNYFVHGVNALAMLGDFVLCRRRWRPLADAWPVIGYGLCNLIFMWMLFQLSPGCGGTAAAAVAAAAGSCNLDGEGHPYVYAVVDWRKPSQAALVSLIAIFIPVPLISLLLGAVARSRDGGAAPAEPCYPYGANHNGTVPLPPVSSHCASVSEVSALLKADANLSSPCAPVRAVGSAKSNTRCLEAPGQLLRLGGLTGIQIAADGKTATVGAGVVLRELSHALAARGLQLYSAIELGNLTAGAMACAHTKNRHLPGEFGILSSYVVGVMLVDASGRVHAISEESHTIDGRAADPATWGPSKRMLAHVRTSHGLLGVICEVTVRVKPVGGRTITHVRYGSAKEFVHECASKHSASGGSIFAYFSPYSERFLVETTRPTAKSPKGSWFWAVREHFITVDFPLLFRLGDALPTFLASALYALLNRASEIALTSLHEHASAPPHAHIGWHDHKSLTKFQWTFLAFPLSRAEAVFRELRSFCLAYKAQTGYCNAYFVSYVMEMDASATFSYAARGPVVTIDPIAANTCDRFLPFCEALVAHLEATVGGLACAFNQSIGVKPRAMGSAVRGNPGAKDFLAKRALMDPHGRFLNPFLEEVLAGVGEAD